MGKQIKFMSKANIFYHFYSNQANQIYVKSKYILSFLFQSSKSNLCQKQIYFIIFIPIKQIKFMSKANIFYHFLFQSSKSNLCQKQIFFIIFYSNQANQIYVKSKYFLSFFIQIKQIEFMSITFLYHTPIKSKYFLIFISN